MLRDLTAFAVRPMALGNFASRVVHRSLSEAARELTYRFNGPIRVSLVNPPLLLTTTITL